MSKKRKRQGRLRVVNPDCAGIDIGKDVHYVAVPGDRCDDPVRSFPGFTRDLHELSQWLQSCGVRTVAMESTSVYWIPVFEVLDRAGFDVVLVSPRATKQISGCKSDVLDCQWIQQLMSYGLLRGAFRPDDEVCPLRSYVRQAKRLTEDRARCVQHMQKALTEMNVRLDSVISDIMGKTGEAILRAIVSGERDCHRLASLRDGRIRASVETIAASLEGTWREEHLFALEQALHRHDFLTAQLDACQRRIAAAVDSLTPPFDPETGEIRDNDDSGGEPAPHTDAMLAHALHRMMGVDLTRIPTIGATTALTIAAEIGPDFSAFPSAQHFCSWLGLAPGTKISGGKKLSGRSSRVVNKVARSLRIAAVTARRSQTFIGAKHRSRLARLEKAVAVNATARELACLIYNMVTRGTQYVERGMEAHERNRTNRVMTSLTRRARQLGFALVAIDENQPTTAAVTTA